MPPMTDAEATEMMEAKIMQIIGDAKQKGFKLKIDPLVIDRIVALSGGHPHILSIVRLSSGRTPKMKILMV